MKDVQSDQPSYIGGEMTTPDGIGHREIRQSIERRFQDITDALALHEFDRARALVASIRKDGLTEPELDRLESILPDFPDREAPALVGRWYYDASAV